MLISDMKYNGTHWTSTQQADLADYGTVSLTEVCTINTISTVNGKTGWRESNNYYCDSESYQRYHS